MAETFYKLFYWLEDNSDLDPTKAEDIFALQFVFIPRINKALAEFVAAWNEHSLRTERSLLSLTDFLFEYSVR